MSWGYYGFRPYVPVAQRRAKAAVFAAKLAKKEKRTLAPIALAGRTIAASFWGKAWCENLERYSDFENRLPRGRTYVRNGSVIDLQIERGKVKALVSGSEVYKVVIDIKTVPGAVWQRVKKDCTRSIDSLLDLLQGRFEQAIMQRLSARDSGLFPQPKEIAMKCSCPDWAGMCKHVAAVLYGVGARLDRAPELLFTLRDVDHLELISQAVDSDNLKQTFKGKAESTLPASDLGEIFGIDLDMTGSGTPVAGKSKAGPLATSSGESPPRPRAQKKPASTKAKQTRRRVSARPVAAAGGRATGKLVRAKQKRKARVAL
jgi:uncharacterized Zn finger protein